MPIALIPIIAGIVEVGAGYAAFSVAAGFTLANVLAGAAMVGGAMQAVGAATGDQHLEKIGSVAGGIGAAGVGIMNLADAVGEGGTNLFAGDTANQFSNVGGGATASETTQAAATGGQTVGQAATNNAAGDIAQSAAATSNLTPAEQSLIDANAAPAGATPPVVSPTGDAGIPGAPGSPSGPAAAPVGGSVNPSPGGGTNLFASDTPGNYSNVGGAGGGAAPGAGADSGSLWDKITKSVGNAWDKDPSAVMKTGAGMVQGLASYVAPSPLERASINEKNAAMERLKYEQQQRANLNNSIRGLGTGAMGPSFNGAPGAAMQPGAPQFGAAPGAIMPTPLPVTGAMPQQQQPGLLQGAMYG